MVCPLYDWAMLEHLSSRAAYPTPPFLITVYLWGKKQLALHPSPPSFSNHGHCLEQRCEITPTGLQTKPTDETTVFPTLSIWLFCLSICFCFAHSTQKSSLLQSCKCSELMLNKEGFDTALQPKAFHKYHVPLRLSKSLPFIHGVVIAIQNLI